LSASEVFEHTSLTKIPAKLAHPGLAKCWFFFVGNLPNSVLEQPQGLILYAPIYLLLLCSLRFFLLIDSNWALNGALHCFRTECLISFLLEKAF